MVCAVLCAFGVAGCGGAQTQPGVAAEPTPTPAPAPTPTPAPAPAPAPERANKPKTADPDHADGAFVWRVQGPSPSWLLGTIHAGVPLHRAPAPLQHAVDRCKVMALEADLDNADWAAARTLMVGLKPGELSGLLGRVEARRLVQLLGMPRAEVHALRPWALWMMLAVKMMPKGAGMDKELLDAAKVMKKRRVFLESTVAPLRILATMPQAAMVRELQEGIRNPEAIAQEMRQLVSVYKAGKVEKLRALTFDTAQSQRVPQLNERFLIGRNKAWLPAIEELIQAGGACIAVGAGHMVGPQGLPKLLRGRGLVVTRVAR